MKPFIKWAGGKKRLTSQILNLLPEGIEHYVEPFFGGGAVFCSVRASRYTVADSNNALVGCLDCLTDPFKIAFLMSGAKLYESDYNKEPTRETFETLRDRFNHSEAREGDFAQELSAVDKSALFLVLNKTCFNGLWRENSKGEFNVSWGKKESVSVFDQDNLHEWHEKLQNTSVLSDYKLALGEASEGSVVYCDPPYDKVKETSFVSYGAEAFDRASQKELKEHSVEAVKRGAFVLISNADTPFIRELYKDCVIHEVMMARSINSKGNGRGKVRELLIEVKA